jgi:hypothetical protein
VGDLYLLLTLQTRISEDNQQPQYDKENIAIENFPTTYEAPSLILFSPILPYKSDSRPRLSEEDFRKGRRVDSFEFKDKSAWL